MNRRTPLASVVVGSTIPLSARGTADSDDLTPIAEMPDYCAVADEREEAVCAWAGEHVQNAQIALVSSQNRDPAEAKTELEAALELLDRELPDA